MNDEGGTKVLRRGVLLIVLIAALSQCVTSSASAAAGMRSITGCAGRPGFQTDADHRLYLVYTQSRDTNLIYIDLDKRQSSVLFTLPGLDADITIGCNEICFRRIEWQPPFVTHLGPHRYYACSIDDSELLQRRELTALWDSSQPNHTRCAFVSDRLLCLVSPSEGAGAPQPFVSTLYVMENDNSQRFLGSWQNCVFMIYDSAVMLIHRDDEDYGFYHVFDPVNEKEYLIPRETNDYNFPQLLLINDMIYVATNRRVFSYNVNDGTTSEIIQCDQTGLPNLTCIGTDLYIFADSDHVLYRYNMRKGTITRQYETPENLPTHHYSIVVDDMLIIGPRQNQLYVYDFVNNASTQIYIGE